MQVACPDRVLPALPAVMKQTYYVYWQGAVSQPGKFPPVGSQRFNTWQPFLLCPIERSMYRPFNTASLRPADTNLSRQCCSCAVTVHAQPWLFLPIFLKNWHTSSIQSRSGIPFYGKPVCPSAEGNGFSGRGGLSRGLLISHSSHAQEGARAPGHPLAALPAAPGEPGFSCTLPSEMLHQGFVQTCVAAEWKYFPTKTCSSEDSWLALVTYYVLETLPLGLVFRLETRMGSL